MIVLDRPPGRDNYTRRNHARQERLLMRLGDTINSHRCDSVHRTPRAFLRCFLNYYAPLWIDNDGPWALFAFCGQGLSVSMFRSRERAERTKARIDRYGCGAYCEEDDGHEIIFVDQTDPQVLAWQWRSGRRRGGEQR